jgi:phosphatidylserine decarboxylase
MRIAKEGYPLIFSGAALSAGAALAGWKTAAWSLAFATLAVAAFFRDPERRVPQAEGLVVSPADGKVVSVAPAADSPLFAEAATRVSIFLSPLDVHINRIPVGGTVTKVAYMPGKFIAAYKDESSKQNEQNALEVLDDKGRLLGVVQVAGVVARRIVCWAKPGSRLARGERFGLIMFGSRTDLYLPPGCSLEVAEGQHVKGGETVIARFV